MPLVDWFPLPPSTSLWSILWSHLCLCLVFDSGGTQTKENTNVVSLYYTLSFSYLYHLYSYLSSIIYHKSLSISLYCVYLYISYICICAHVGIYIGRVLTYCIDPWILHNLQYFTSCFYPYVFWRTLLICKLIGFYCQYCISLYKNMDIGSYTF